MLSSYIRTLLTEQFHLTTPIVQAPIGGASCPALCAAVANAGGIGLLSVTWREPEEIRRVLRETHALTPTGVTGVNLILEWNQEERVRICLEEGCSLFSFAWGDASPYITDCHAAGAIVMQTVGSAEEAERAVDAGVDIIVAQGWEAGGHVWSEVSTLTLVPRIVDAVPFCVPVIAAGGIADGRGMAAALLLGAAGVWVGTRFLVSEEAAIHPLYQKRLLSATETETVYSMLFDGDWPNAPHRTLRNSTVAAWEAAGRPSPGNRPGEGETIATSASGRAVVRYEDTMPTVGMTGEVEALACYAGQSVGLLHRIQPAAEIVREMTEEAIMVLRGGADLLWQP